MCSPNRTLVIPGGTLDGSVTNVVMIPYQLEDPNFPLVVRAPALNRSAPIQGRPGFFRWQGRRFATSLDGSLAPKPRSFYYERDFEVPVGISTPQSDVDDDYYFDMYDTDEDVFVGGESGNLSGSAMERLIAGELNQVEGVEPEPPAPPEPPRPRTPLEESEISFHDSTVRSSGYEGSAEPYIPSHYTPYSPSVPHYSYEGEYGAPEMPRPNCEPCFPGNGGNFERCPQTCPTKRGIPFGDPNVEGDYLPMPEVEPPEEFSRSRSRSGPLMNVTGPVLNRTRPRGACTPPPALDRTRPALNRTCPRGELNRTRPVVGGCPVLNRTGPVVNPELNRTRPTGGVCSGALNRTRPGPSGLNRTRPRISPSLNRTRPTAGPVLNTTGPVVSRNGSRINLNLTVELEPERQPLNRASPVADALNRTRPMPVADALNRTRPMPVADALNRTRPMPVADALNRTRPMPVNMPQQTPNNPPPQRRQRRQQRSSCKPCYQVVTKKRFG